MKFGVGYSEYNFQIVQRSRAHIKLKLEIQVRIDTLNVLDVRVEKKYNYSQLN